MRHAIAATLLVVVTTPAAAQDAKKPAAPAADAGKAEEYVVDVAHSKVGFEVSHLVISTVDGSFDKFEGTYTTPDKVTKDNVGQMKLTATADASSIDTGIQKRDDHLRSADFFDAKKFPTLKFVSTGVEFETEKKLKLKGDLTIKDKTKPVVFDLVYKGTVSAYDKKRTAFKATTEINRKEFGLGWNDVVEAGPVVGDTVTIELVVEGIRKSDM